MRFFGLCVGKKHGYFRESPENQQCRGAGKSAKPCLLRMFCR